MIAKGLEIDLAEFLLRADLSETFTLISEGIIAVGVIRQDVIIISLRGTRPLYLTDWMTDLSFGRIRVNTSRGSFHLHGGFFESVVEFVERLSLEGAEVWTNTPAEFRDHISKEMVRWGELVKRTGIKVE